MKRNLLACALLLSAASGVKAGMPTVTAVLDEVPRLRMQSISFFLVGFLLCCWFVQLVWNGLRKDAPSLPRLSYLRAVGLVTLWGLLFVLVLTMISGARELMTPGAWEPDGFTHKLARKPGDVVPDESQMRERREALERLKAALWEKAKAAGGKLPAASELPEVLWRLPGPSGARYVYAGGTASVFDGAPLAWEPEAFDGDRWMLLTDGTIKRMTTEGLRDLLARAKR